MRFGSGNSAYPFEFNSHRYLAMVDFGVAQKGMSDAQGVIIDVTSWTNPIEVFRTATMGDDYNNGTTGVAVWKNATGFNVYFLSPNGLYGYALTSTKLVGVVNNTIDKQELFVTTDPVSRKVIFSEFVDKVRVYQVQSGIEVRNAANIKELQLSDKGAYILNVVQKDGRVVNKRVIL